MLRTDLSTAGNYDMLKRVRAYRGGMMIPFRSHAELMCVLFRLLAGSKSPKPLVRSPHDPSRIAAKSNKRHLLVTY